MLWKLGEMNIIYTLKESKGIASYGCMKYFEISLFVSKHLYKKYKYVKRKAIVKTDFTGSTD